MERVNSVGMKEVIEGVKNQVDPENVFGVGNLGL